MEQVEQAVQIMTGLSFLVLGVSVLLRTADWAGWIEAIGKAGHRAILTLGAVNIVFGTFIIGFHWVWSGWAMVLTIVGLLLTLRGILCLVFPGFMASMLTRMESCVIPALRLGGMATILIALAVLYPAFYTAWEMSAQSGTGG